MHERDEGAAPGAATDSPDLELRLLALADTLLAFTGLARIDLQRSAVAAPRWVLLSLVRVLLWLLFWLSLSVLLSYLAYAASASVAMALTTLVLLQGGVCLLLELRRRSLWHRLSFIETRRGSALNAPIPRWRQGTRRRSRAARMSTTDAKAWALQERIVHNRELNMQGAVDGEREALQQRVAGPLVGMALLAGLACGGGGASLSHVLRDPMMREVLHILDKLTEKPRP